LAGGRNELTDWPGKFAPRPGHLRRWCVFFHIQWGEDCLLSKTGQSKSRVRGICRSAGAKSGNRLNFLAVARRRPRVMLIRGDCVSNIRWRVRTANFCLTVGEVNPNLRNDSLVVRKECPAKRRIFFRSIRLARVVSGGRVY